MKFITRLTPTLVITAAVSLSAEAEKPTTFDAGPPVLSMAFLSEDQIACFGCEMTEIGPRKYAIAPAVTVVDLKGGKNLFEVRGDTAQRGYTGSGFPEGLAISPDAETVAWIGVNSEFLAHLWDADEGQHGIAPAPGIRSSSSVAFTPDGKELYVASYDGTITRWDLTNQKQRGSIKTGFASLASMTMSADGRLLACADRRSKVIKVLSLPGGDPVLELEYQARTSPSLSFSPDGRWLAAAGNGPAFIWEIASGAAVYEFRSNEAKAVRFDHTGLRLALGNLTGDIALHNYLSEDTFMVLEGAPQTAALAFSPEGTRLAASGAQGRNSTVGVWTIPPASKVKHAPLTGEQRLRSWEKLRVEQAATEMLRLARDPSATVTLIGEQLKAIPASPAVDLKEIAKLIEDLDAVSFNVRSKATAELAEIGSAAGPLLKKALNEQPSAEKERRINVLLRTMGSARIAPEELQIVRAVQILELIGNDAAIRLLGGYAKGAPQARLTLEAKQSLERLKPSHPSKP